MAFSPRADLRVAKANACAHPTHSVWEGKTYDHPRQHSIVIMCDDIDATVDELRTKGAQFRGPIEEREYGRIIMMIVPWDRRKRSK